MEGQYIQQETAKLAKEKGFNLESIHYYFISSEGKFGSKTPTRQANCYKHDWNSYPTKMRISCILQSVLQRWLREIHKIIIIVDFYNDGDEWEDTSYGVKVSEFKHFKTHDSFIKYDFKTYEEALEIGLQEGLKLI